MYSKNENTSFGSKNATKILLYIALVINFDKNTHKMTQKSIENQHSPLDFDPSKNVVLDDFELQIPNPLTKYYLGIGEVKGFKFYQEAETPYGYIYRVENEGIIWYEVFKRKVNTMYNNVSYPRSTSFGKWAWTKRSKKEAELKLKSLKNKQ